MSSKLIKNVSLSLLQKSLPEENAECGGPSNQDDDGDKDAKKKKNRCVTCRKKVGLTGETKNFVKICRKLNLKFFRI